MTQSLNDSLRSIVVATILLIVLGIAISYVLSRRLSRPLHELLNASRAFGNGQYGYRFDDRRNDELGFLMRSFNSMAQGLLQKAQVEDAFSRYVPSGVAQRILANVQEVEVGGKQIFGSVMFVDIVGFTAKSETMTPEGVAELLNEFYTDISRAAGIYHGTIDKYMGDCAMLVFGVPEEDPDDVFHSLACAVFFQKLVHCGNGIRTFENKSPVHFRIGINSGIMLAGNIGSNERMQFTVVGDSVNLASRLCSVSSTDQIIITEETYGRPGIRERIVASRYRSIRLRGKSHPVNTYLVHDVSEEYRAEMDQQIETILRTRQA